MIEAKIKILLTVLLFVFSTIATAQQPAHFSIGEEELEGLEIYSTLKDDQNNIWLATGQGLYKFDGYQFTLIHSDINISPSLFGLVNDKKGNIYCHNLNGQIFKIVDNQLKLFFTLPDSIILSMMDMCIGKDNELYCSGKKIAQIDTNGNARFIEFSGKSHFTKLTVYKNDVYCISRGSQINILKNGKFVPVNDSSPRFFASKIFSDETGFYFLDEGSFDLYHYSERGLKKIELYHPKEENLDSREIFITNNDEIWVNCSNGGVLIYSLNGEVKYGGKRQFQNYYTSCLTNLEDGSIILSTFDNGLIFIPATENTSFANHEIGKTPARKVRFDKKGNLYILNKNNQIVQLSPDLTTDILYQHNQKSEYLEYGKNNNLLYFQTGDGLSYIDLMTGKHTVSYSNIGSVKGLTYINDSILHVATGCQSLVYNLNRNKIQTRVIFNRSRQAFRDTVNKVTYFADVKGLYTYAQDSIVKIKNDLLKFAPNDIAGSGDTIWASTTTEGIFQYKNGKLIGKITTENGLKTNNIKNLRYKNGFLFINSNQGLHIYNPKTKEITTLDKTDGLVSNRILDFDVFQNKIAIVTSSEIQIIDLKNIRKNQFPPIIEFDRILMEDSLLVFHQNAKLSYNQNELEFKFKGKAFRHRKNLKYKYRLIGLDSNWKYNSYEENHVKYFSIPEGNYTFQVIALNENQIESKPLSFVFSISPPFWRTWWFVSAISLFAIGLAYYFYKQQLDKSKQKNEVTHSKLTALKSQMNPHFIFNALNSIQDLILKEEVEKSYNYITKFANLVRKTLNYSGKDFIDFEDEIGLLEIYLELEKLRFKDNFEVQLKYGDIEEIIIPPMIVQPFVENAIKHGLLHKEGHKKLEIIFQQTEILTCTVRDNGIGRKKARQIKARQKAYHESFSLKAIRSRFEILKSIYKTEIGIEIKDLFKNDTPVGTEVIIKLPFRQKF